ncbi:2-succinylbenzoate--CoA ligase [Phormidesmis priestleyi]
MATPLTHLLEHSREDWLIGYSVQNLIEQTQKRYQEITPQIQTILLAERDPIRFLSSFIAACSTNCQVFLCNPDWAEAEWQQVFELVQPDLIWGEAPFKQRTEKRPSTLQTSLILIPTGGTSGKVRFAMHTWETLTASVQGFREYFGVDRIHSFCVLPLYHVSGLMQFIRSFTSNGKLIILPWKSLETDAKELINPQNIFLSLVPTQLQKLLNLHPLKHFWLSQFRTILLGGAPAWPELLKEARSMHLPIAPTYGMTETASQIATLKSEDFSSKNFTCVKPLPHVKITIRNPKNELLNIGEIGKITIQSDALMLGYYPKLSNNPLYQPDDLGFFDSQGYLHIIGRDSQKIITGGENVFPSEVEAAILATKMVKDVCVIGIPDQMWGQIVTAVYVPNANLSDEIAISSSDPPGVALTQKLSKFKHPKRWIAIAHLPRNSQGKINHSHLRDQLKEMMNAEQ